MANPMYRQIAENLREQIESGQLPEGTQVPTEIELREEYDASRNTIRDAIKWLVNLGLVETRPGQGTFVSRKIHPFVNIVGAHLTDRRGTSSSPRVQIMRADSPLAAELAVPEGTSVVSRQQLRYIDGTPWSLQTAFYPMTLVTRGAAQLLEAEDIPMGTHVYIRETLGIGPGTWRARLAARSPGDDEAQFFGLGTGIILVVDVRQTYYEQPEIPYCVTVTTYPADRNLFVVTAGTVPSDE